MTDLPAPPIPALDLRRLYWLKLDVTALLNSDFNATVDDTGWRCGITLYLKAWHQTPCSSLPDDDAVLCALAGLGRDLGTWHRVRSVALHGWVKCSDGRLYHPFLAQIALEAWEEYEASESRRERDRARKRAKLAKVVASDQTQDSAAVPDGTATEFQVETALQDKTGYIPPSPPLSAPAEPPQARQVVDPGPTATTTARTNRGRQGTARTVSSAATETTEVSQWRQRLQAGPRFWLASWGPRPGDPGCEAPMALISKSPWAAAVQVVGTA